MDFESPLRRIKGEPLETMLLLTAVSGTFRYTMCHSYSIETEDRGNRGPYEVERISLVMMTDRRFRVGATLYWCCDKERSDVRRMLNKVLYVTASKMAKTSEDG